MASETSAERWQLVRGSSIPAKLRLTLYALHCFQGNHPTAFCDRQTLADEVGVCVDELTHKLKALEDLGVITRIWTSRNRRSSRQFKIEYEVLENHQRSTLRKSSDYQPSTLSECSECESTSLSECSELPRASAQTYSERTLSRIHIEDSKNIQGRSIQRNSANSCESRPLEKGRKKQSPSPEISEDLKAFCREWNELHSSGLVRSKIRDIGSPGKTIIDAWKRSQKDPEQYERLKDLQAIRAAIEASQQFLKTAGWFDAAGLIGGKNSNHRWYAEQLMAGTYRDKPATGTESNPEAEKAWQSIKKAAKDHYGDQKGYEAAIGPKLAGILRRLGLTRSSIDGANDYERREQRSKFIQEYSQCQGAA